MVTYLMTFGLNVTSQISHKFPIITIFLGNNIDSCNTISMEKLDLYKHLGVSFGSLANSLLKHEHDEEGCTLQA